MKGKANWDSKGIFRTYCVFVLIAIFSGWCVAYKQHPVINKTISLPKGLYWLKDSSGYELKRMDKAAFKIHGVVPEWISERYAKNELELHLFKTVLGVPGDEIKIRDHEIWICREDKCGLAGIRMDRDSKGRELTWEPLPSIIPEGYYYLGSRAPRGLDCRYIGLIPRNAIREIGDSIIELPWDVPQFSMVEKRVQIN